MDTIQSENPKSPSADVVGKASPKRNPNESDPADPSDNFDLNNITFSDEVSAVMQDVLKLDEPITLSNFNPTDYINQLFPTEQSLSNIEEVMTHMECDIGTLNDNIRLVVRNQSHQGVDGRRALNRARKLIVQLFGQITEIKSRAERTEQIVKEITRDIKQLDCAKRNLTTAITTLNHLHMLVGGVETLTSLAERRQYAELLNPLQAITIVNQHFQQFTDIPQIKELADMVEQIENNLASQITQDFHNVFGIGGPNTGTGSSKMTLAQLSDACQIVSVLDPKVKRDILKWFLNLQLQEYQQLYQENQDIAWLDKIDKRYAWFKRHLLDFEEKYGKVFPADWEVSERMTVQFCEITNTELTRIMTKRRTEIDVKLLLFAITKTNAFEVLLSKRFTGTTLPQATANPEIPFEGLIGSCFLSHLDIYTDSIDRNLAGMIERFGQDKTMDRPTIAAGTTATIYPSCADLFLFYKKSMTQCGQLCNGGKAMYDLSLIFKRYLREYAVKFLEQKIPKTTAIQTSLGTSMSLLTKDLQNLSTVAGQVVHNFLKDSDVTPRYTTEEIVRLCMILTTGEYCLETVQQLEDKLKEKVASTYANQIDLSDEKDIYHRIISNCVQLMVQDVEGGCEPALIAMSKVQWQNINNVGDQSPFVNSINNNFKQTVPTIRDSLSTCRKYFTQFCLKFISSFIPRYINTLHKCRPTATISSSAVLAATSITVASNISYNSNSVQVGSTHSGIGLENTIQLLGCEQLLLDTHSIKTILLDLPSIGSQVNRKAPPAYTKAVVRGMTKAEMIIKIVMAPLAPAHRFIEQCLKLLPGVTIAEFQKILDMKGVRRVDQMPFVDLFKQQAPKENQTDSVIGLIGGTESVVTTGDQRLGDGNVEKTNQISGTSEMFGNVERKAQDFVVDSRGRIKKLENLIKKRFPN